MNHWIPTDLRSSGIPPPGSIAPLDDIDIHEQLDARPCRPANVEHESRAFGLLAKTMAENPRHMLQKLVEAATRLCDADTAGVSLLEADLFRWEAVAGVYAAARGTTMPRDASPCGVCIDRGTTQLMLLADRRFQKLPSEPRFVEAMFVPFYDHDTPIGTVWIVTHRLERTFDRQDEKTLGVFAQFASAGWQLWKAYEAALETSHRKGDVFTTLAHELRNPLAAIAGAAAILRVRTASDAVSATHAIDVIVRQCQHLSRLIHDLLDVARAGNARLDLEQPRADFPDGVEKTVQGIIELGRQASPSRTQAAGRVKGAQRQPGHVHCEKSIARTGHARPRSGR